MRVFPPRVLRGTKQYDATGLMRATASLWDLWSGAIAERNKAHSLAIGREAANSARPLKIWKTWSKAERLSSLERRKRSIIKNIGFSRYLAYGGLS